MIESPPTLLLSQWVPLNVRGVVAQLVRVPDCRSGGCGFEPRRPRFQGLASNFAGKAFCLVDIQSAIGNGVTNDPVNASATDQPTQLRVFSESLAAICFIRNAIFKHSNFF